MGRRRSLLGVALLLSAGCGRATPSRATGWKETARAEFRVATTRAATWESVLEGGRGVVDHHADVLLRFETESDRLEVPAATGIGRPDSDAVWLAIGFVRNADGTRRLSLFAGGLTWLRMYGWNTQVQADLSLERPGADLRPWLDRGRAIVGAQPAVFVSLHGATVGDALDLFRAVLGEGVTRLHLPQLAYHPREGSGEDGLRWLAAHQRFDGG